MPAAGERERAPSISGDVWERASDRAKTEGLPLIWVLSRALDSYASETLPLPRAETIASPGGRRGRSVFATDAAWKAADKRRGKDKVASMSALCEILLDAYARQEIHPHAVVVTTAQRDQFALPVPTAA